MLYYMSRDTGSCAVGGEGGGVAALSIQILRRSLSSIGSIELTTQLSVRAFVSMNVSVTFPAESVSVSTGAQLL